MPRQSPSAAAKKREAARLNALRQKMGLSQRDMAREFMVAHGAIGQWERGDRTIPGPVLKLIHMYEERLKSGNESPIQKRLGKIERIPLEDKRFPKGIGIFKNHVFRSNDRSDVNNFPVAVHLDLDYGSNRYDVPSPV